MANKQVTFPLNDVDYQAEDMQLWHSTRTNGVFSQEGEFITTTTTGMKINVSAGRAWFSYEKFKGVIFGNFDNFELTVDTADGILGRKDYVVIRFDVINNKTELKVKKGVPGSDPHPPILERDKNTYFELAIAEILIPKGVVSLNNSMITDTRLDPTVCGIMKDGVTSIPTDGLLQQYRTWYNTNTTAWENQFNTWFSTNTTTWQNDFDTWFAGIKTDLEGDVAANLLAKINQNTADITALENEVLASKNVLFESINRISNTL